MDNRFFFTPLFISTKISLIELKNGNGEMTSLQTLRNVDLNMDGATKAIKELGRLKEKRDLRVLKVHEEDESILSSSINEMQNKMLNAVLKVINPLIWI